MAGERVEQPPVALRARSACGGSFGHAHQPPCTSSARVVGHARPASAPARRPPPRPARATAAEHERGVEPGRSRRRRRRRRAGRRPPACAPSPEAVERGEEELRLGLADDLGLAPRRRLHRGERSRPCPATGHRASGRWGRGRWRGSRRPAAEPRARRRAGRRSRSVVGAADDHHLGARRQVGAVDDPQAGVAPRGGAARRCRSRRRCRPRASRPAGAARRRPTVTTSASEACTPMPHSLRTWSSPAMPRVVGDERHAACPPRAAPRSRPASPATGSSPTHTQPSRSRISWS